MTSSVFFKTWLKDLFWLEWSFRFVRKNWKTESQFVVCCPYDCVDRIKGLQEVLGHPITIAPMDQWPNGYLHQQYMKMNADVYCSGDMITYIDSDAMLMMPTDVEKDLCVDGKPIIWQTPYSQLRTPWQPVVARVMSLQPQYEYMRCFPITYCRSTPKQCREHLENMHGVPLHALIQGSSVGWTEFNVMGFYAAVFQANLYTFKNTDEMFLQENKEHHWHDRVRQFHNVMDWHPGTIPALKDLYGEPVEDSFLDEETSRIVRTPTHGQLELIDKILPLIDPDTIAVDVGAHEGLHSVAYAKAGAEVIAFEPMPESFVKLWRALEGIGTAIPYAVTEYPKTIRIHQDCECSEATYTSINGEGQDVNATSLDAWFSAHPPDKRIGLIKIDVEGFEPFVLRGTKRIVDEHRPVLVIECQKATLERNGFTRSDIDTFLDEHGYKRELSTTDPRSSTNEDYFFDIIATPLPPSDSEQRSHMLDAERVPQC